MNTGALTIMPYSQTLSLNVLEIHYSCDEYKTSLFLYSKSLLVLYKQLQTYIYREFTKSPNPARQQKRLLKSITRLLEVKH